MTDSLKTHGILAPKGTRKVLRERCTQLGIPIHQSIDVINERLLHKPKGSLQILFERGWIDPTLIHLYTGVGRKDAADGVVEDIPRDPTGCKYSLNAIIELQADFLEEITLLQFYAQ